MLLMLPSVVVVCMLLVMHLPIGHGKSDDAAGEDAEEKVGGLDAGRGKREGKRRGVSGVDQCARQWREDSLEGRCFGVGPYLEMFPAELAQKTIKTAKACKRACCKLGPKCITWQFGGGTHNDECRMGGPVRYGDEASGVSGWCEPKAPRRWEGFKVTHVEGGGCLSAGDLPGQCFGLGPEVLSERKERLTVDECRRRCCADSTCSMWQALPDRGCFMNSGEHWCDPTVQAYVGSRKCARGYCGGKEDELEVVDYSGKLA